MSEKARKSVSAKLLAAVLVALTLLALFACCGALAEIASGKWGTCPWTLDNEGVLTVGIEDTRTDGSNIGSLDDQPWRACRTDIKEAVFLGEVKLPARSCYLFAGCENLESIDFGSDSPFLTSSYYALKDMSHMFDGCRSLKSLNIRSWVTGMCEDMSYAFSGCASLEELDLSLWDTDRVKQLRGMFSGCASLRSLTLGTEHGTYWSTTWAEDMTDMFEGCDALETVFLASCFNFQMGYEGQGTFLPGKAWMVESQGFRTVEWISNHTYRGTMTRMKAADTVSGTWGTCPWTLDENGLLTIGQGGSITEGSGTVPWTTTYAYAPYSYSEIIRKVIFRGTVVFPANSAAVFYNCKYLTEVSGTEHVVTSQVTNMKEMFAGCERLTHLDLHTWDTSRVTTLEGAFACPALETLDVSTWDTSSVTNMKSVFGSTVMKDLDVSGWDTSRVTNMEFLFAYCSSLEKLDLNAWDTSSVTYMDYAFRDCTSLSDLKISDWNTSGAVYMSEMFAGCESLTGLDLNGWDTSRVYWFDGMFSGCKRLGSLSISRWDTSYAVDFRGMFKDCAALEGLNLGGWNTRKAVAMEDMFSGCDSLRVVLLGSDFTFKGSMNEVLTTLPGAMWYSNIDSAYFTTEDIAAVRNGIRDTYEYAFEPFLTWDDLHYSFENAYFEYHDYPYYIPLYLYRVFSPYGVAHFWYLVERAIGPWGGSCSGFVASSVLFNGAGSGLSLESFQADHVRDLSQDSQSNTYMIHVFDENGFSQGYEPLRIEDLIDAFQAFSGRWSFLQKHKNNLDEIVKAVQEGRRARHLPTICFNKHTVVGYEVKEENGETRIYVYNPDDKDSPGYIRLFRDEHGDYIGWRFDREYNSDTSPISIVPYLSIKELWENRDQGMLIARGDVDSSDSEQIFVYVGAPSFSVFRGGAEVARMEQGVFSSASADIELCLLPNRPIDDAKNVISLPKAEYSIRIDGNEPADKVIIADDRQFAMAETTATFMTLHTLDADQQNMISLAAKEGDAFTVTLGSSLTTAADMEKVVIRGVAENAVTKIGISGSEWTVDNCEAVSITVNGSELRDGGLLFNEKKNINLEGVRLAQDSYLYTGEAICPGVVLPDGTALIEGTDYEITYENNVNPTHVGSTPTAVIRGIGAYTGEKTLTFQIRYEGEPLHLPSSLRAIESKAFAETGAKYVVIPESVTSIALDAFPENAILILKPGSPLIEWAEENGIHYNVQ